MTLGDFIDVFDSIHPFYVQSGEEHVTYYEDRYEFLDQNEVGVYGREWSFDDTVTYITLDSEGITVVEIEEE